MLAYWEDDDTFQASVEQRDAGRERRQRVRLLRRPAVRQRAAALRPPAHRLRQGPDPALPDDARPPGRAPLRLGHPRPARRARGDAPARHQDHRRDPRAGHREVQRGVPQVGLRVHRRVARVRHPPGPLGRLRQRLPDPRPRLHGVGDVGLQAAATTRGWPTRASASCPTAGTTRPRCPTTSCGWTRTSTRCAQDPAVTVGLPPDERHRPRARWPWSGRRRPWTLPSNLAVMVGPRHRLRRGRVGRHRHHRALRRSREARLAAYARELERRQRVARPGRAAADRAPTCSGAPTRRRSPTTLGHAHAFRVVEADVRHHRRTAPGWCTPPAPSVRRTRWSPTARASSRSCRSAKDGTLHLPGRRLRRHARLRRQPARSSTTSRPPTARRGRDRLGHARHGAAAPRVLRALLPALLALPRAADLHGRLVVVRRATTKIKRPDARPQPADPLGARPRQGRPVRQVAGEHPRLVDLPQPVLGQPGPGLAERRPGVPPDRRLRLARRARARLRRRGPTTCTGRSSTS